MNWDAIGAVGEIVGAIAVVVTLAYLAIQIQQNTRMMRREAHLDRVRHIADPLIDSPDRLAKTLSKVSEKEGSREPVTLEFMKEYELAPSSFVVTINEGWRGEVSHCILTDDKGKIQRYKVKDPSFHNWTGLAMSLRDEEISDFPLCNKSFNLSYCGFDL